MTRALCIRAGVAERQRGVCPSPKSQAPSLRQARGQASPVDMVEVEPITCWWRTSDHRGANRGAVRLTAHLLGGRDRSQQGRAGFFEARSDRGAAAAVRGAGRHARGDLVTPGKRFFQYDYRLRLIERRPVRRRRADSAARDFVSHREPGHRRRHRPGTRAVVLAAARLGASDLDRARRYAATFAKRRRRRSRASKIVTSRANLLQTIAGVLFGLAGVIARDDADRHDAAQDPRPRVDGARVSRRAPMLAAANRELDEVQRASRGGWTPELAGRALAALRIAGTYAIGTHRWSASSRRRRHAGRRRAGRVRFARPRPRVRVRRGRPRRRPRWPARRTDWPTR